MASTVIRVDERIHIRLKEMADSEQRSIGQVLADLVDQYERDTFWKAVHDGFAALRDDPEAWEGYQRETALWDSTASDGLEGEEPYYTPEEEAEIDAEYTAAQSR